MNEPEVTMPDTTHPSNLIVTSTAVEAAGKEINLVTRVPAPLRALADQVRAMTCRLLHPRRYRGRVRSKGTAASPRGQATSGVDLERAADAGRRAESVTESVAKNASVVVAVTEAEPETGARAAGGRFRGRCHVLRA